MKTSYQMIAVLMLAALVAVSPFDCPPVSAGTNSLGNTISVSALKTTSTITVTNRNTVFVLALEATSTTSTPEAESIAISTVTVTVRNTVSVPATSTTSAPEVGSIATTDGSDDHMTIAITNTYGNPLSLSFASNAGGPSPVGNPSATTLPDNTFTEYAFPTGWAGRIYVGPNLNPDGSKVEGSYTGPPDIDVSYVDGYSVPITCSSEGTAVSGCNIDLFKQPGIPCNNQVDGPVCLNPAQKIANGPAPPFFAACAGAAYTYPNDNEANGSNLKSNLVSCCIGSSCKAPSRQPQRDNLLHGARLEDVKRGLLLPLAPRLRHRHHPPRRRIHD